MLAGAQELNRNRLSNFTVHPLTEINCSHTASPQRPDQSVGAAILDVAASDGIEYFLRSTGNTGCQLQTLRRIETPQGFQFGAKFWCDLPFDHHALALTRGQVGQFAKQKTHLIVHLPGLHNSANIDAKRYSRGVSTTLPDLLERSRTGDEAALNELVTALYGELHRVASRHLRGERSGHTLQTTALVHEVYLKLAGNRDWGFNDRVHFLSVASRVMRQVLVDYARARATKKRAGDEHVKIQPLTTGILMEAKAHSKPVELLDLEAALKALAREAGPLEELIEMRYFGGMTAEETAKALGQSVHVVRHDLRLAQAWLSRWLAHGRSVSS